MSRARMGGHAAWAVLGQGAGQMLSLLVFLVIARFVSQASFGLVAVSLAVVEVVRRLLIDPVTNATNARTEVSNRDYDLCFNVILILGGLSAGVVALSAAELTRLIGSPEAAPVLRVLSVILLVMGLAGTHGAWLARHMRFRALAVRSTLSVVAGGVVGLGMAFAGFDLWSLVGQQLTINLFNIITLWVSAPYRPRPWLPWAGLRDLWRRARHISLGAAWNAVATDADLFFASAWFGPAAAGIYNAAKRIMLSANMMLVNAISSVTLPALAGIADDRARARAFAGGLTMMSLAVAPAFAGLAAASPFLVHLLLGARWEASAPILTALAASGYLAALGQFASSALLVEQRSHHDALTSGVAAGANVAMLWIAAPHGPVALAAGVSMATLIVLPLRLRFAMHAMGLGWRTIGTALLPSVAAAIAMMAALFAMRPVLAAVLPGPVVLMVMIPAGMLLYGGLLRMVAPQLFRTTFATALEMAGRGKRPVEA